MQPLTSVRRISRALRHRERGAALLMALFAVVILATIVSGAMFVSQQEYRSSRNTLVEQRAFAVAEYGLNAEVSNWDRRRNLPAPKGWVVGQMDTTRVYVASGDSARVAIKRISDYAFWVVSEGRASIGASQLESGRQTSALVQIAYPSIKPKGAITSAGDVRVQGDADVTGINTDPPGWGAQCATFPADTLAGVVVRPGATVTSTPGKLKGDPPILNDPAAADSNTYVRYGTESWNSLKVNADILLPGGVYNDFQPSGTATTCNFSVSTNWGEPKRPGTVAGCYTYYPIIHVDGNLKITGNARGQGILLVNGDLEVAGTLDFYGLLIVRDDLVKATGSANIMGSVFAANLIEATPTSWLTGTQDVTYSACAVESALRGSAILVRVKERHWAQVF